MKKEIIFLLFLMLGNTICTAQEQPVLMVGDKAPELEVGSWIKNSTDAEIKEGEISVVEFWATWCAPCIANFPHLSEVARSYKDEGVKVFGISVMERKETSLETIQDFVQSQGDKMDYIVGVDTETGYMAENWLSATGQRGIPYAVIVDAEGLIAWMGHPKNVEEPLDLMVNGQWDIEEKAREYVETQELKKIDGSYIPKLNSYMGNDYLGALVVIDSIRKEHPKLKYYPNLSHYTFVSLLYSQQYNDAESFARDWWKNSDIPNWKTITDLIEYHDEKQDEKLPSALYRLAIDGYEAQLENYPWSMDFPGTYKIIADYYEKVGDSSAAREMLEKVEETKQEN